MVKVVETLDSTIEAPRGNAVRHEVLSAFRDVMPFILAAIPSGILFGALAGSNGLSTLETILMSALVYSGAAQYIGMALIANDTPTSVILLTTLMLSIRLLLYSTYLAKYIKNLSISWRAVLAFGLIDAVFFVVKDHYERDGDCRHKHWYFLAAVLVLYFNWVACTLIGIAIGEALSGLSDVNLDFAMYAAFAAMLGPYLKNKVTAAVVIASGIAIVVTSELPYNLGIVVTAFFGMGIGVSFAKFNNQGEI